MTAIPKEINRFSYLPPKIKYTLIFSLCFFQPTKVNIDYFVCIFCSSHLTEDLTLSVRWGSFPFYFSLFSDVVAEFGTSVVRSACVWICRYNQNRLGNFIRCWIDFLF
ncbi:hypothetical protein C8039_12645 [Halogeometricum sp. wsp3]|nr:hypothetical protein C8039_12645 [Halogeometricum sp. wsp3]